jgi:threonine/homoserine/homoserine lactone efflux protein
MIREPVQLLPFLAVSTLVVVTPGVDMALVTKNAMLHGRSAARATAFGVNLGIFIWTLAAALGLAAVVAASAAAFTAIKLLGALYLVYLGARVLLGSHEPRVVIARGSAFRQGLVSNLLNPKVAVFFTSLLPQFVDADHAQPQDLLLLGLLFNCLGVVWLLIYAELAARGRNLLRRPRVKRALDRVTGVALVGLGVRLAFERR